MSEDFQKKINEYRDGKLSEEESKKVEEEIERISAVIDYLNEEEDSLLLDMEQPLWEESEKDLQTAKGIKRKINRRILFATARVVILIWLITSFLMFAANGLINKIFALDYKEAFVARSTLQQMLEVFLPDYEYRSTYGTETSFSRQEMSATLERTAGHSTLDNMEVTVKYMFGKPRSSNALENTAFYSLIVSQGGYISPYDYPADSNSGFLPLENAPSGTVAKVLIVFSEPLTPEDLRDTFIDQLYPKDQDPVQVSPLFPISNLFIIGNPSYYSYTPVYPFGDDQQDVMENRGELEALFRSYDNQVHTDSIIGNLQLIQNNEELLVVLFGQPELLQNMDLPDVIADIEENGVKYFGAYFTADTKDLLELKGNPLIHSIQVESIVLW